MIKINCSDAVKWANEYDGPLFHALLSDPPYHLTSIVKRFGKEDSAPAQFGTDGVFSRASKGFMGQVWDGGDIAFQPETWYAFSKVLYPGAFGMAFASSRGWHRLAVAIEDAGFIIHPTIFGWCYGSGFPKASRIDTQIQPKSEWEKTGKKHVRNVKPYDDENGWNENDTVGDFEYSEPTDPVAREWMGHRYGLQALKPALEPIIVFQKPYEGKPIDCMVETGAGALNIDAARIPTNPEVDDPRLGGNGNWRTDKAAQRVYEGGYAGENIFSSPLGRWPANFILEDKEAAEALDRQSGESKSTIGNPRGTVKKGMFANSEFNKVGTEHEDSGGASRFFFNVQEQIDESDPVYYCSKASKSERDAGLEKLPIVEYKTHGEMGEDDSGNNHNTTGQKPAKAHNPHPTVKPIALSRYLATLLLPPDMYAPRRLFVPFSGVASECIGAYQAGWEEIEGVEAEEKYCDIARVRAEYWTKKRVLKDPQERLF